MKFFRHFLSLKICMPLKKLVDLDIAARNPAVSVVELEVEISQCCGNF